MTRIFPLGCEFLMPFLEPSGMMHRNVRSPVQNLRRSGLDANRLCQARKQYLIEKWAGRPGISTGPLEEIRRMRMTL